MDVRERVLLRDGQPVPLTPKAFDLLAALLDRPGRLITKDELLEKVWPDTFVEEANLAYHVFALRKALGDTATGATYIETVPKRGYRFTAPVSHSPGTSEPGAPVVPPPSALGWAMPRIRWVALAFGLVVVLSAATRVWRPAGVDPPRERPLTSLPGVVQSPSLSPDGRYVAFAWRRPDESGFDLFIQQIGVGSPLQLTTHPGDDVSPAWSPDGRAIAFFRRTESGAYGELWTIAPLGGGERKVADVAPRLGGFRAPVPTWCPDSRCVLATDSPGADQADAIFAVAVDTGEKRQVTFPQGRRGTRTPPSRRMGGG